MAGSRLVANTGGYQTNTEKSRHVEENRANAQLISATVELYTVCHAMRQYIDDRQADYDSRHSKGAFWRDSNPHERELYDQIVAALDQAEGRE